MACKVILKGQSQRIFESWQHGLKVNTLSPPNPKGSVAMLTSNVNFHLLNSML